MLFGRIKVEQQGQSLRRRQRTLVPSYVCALLERLAKATRYIFCVQEK
jgi:hypothetical protein